MLPFRGTERLFSIMAHELPTDSYINICINKNEDTQ
jgi:hypothetical protein